MILAINRGSSSIKFALYPLPVDQPAVSGRIERIGLPGARMSVSGEPQKNLELPDHSAALRALTQWLAARAPRLTAAAHRIVHGGLRFDAPALATPEVLRELHSLAPLAPEHLPAELEAVDAIAQLYPGLPQVLCFDTAFHRHMPRVAQLYGLPRGLAEAGLLRYGFHGLAYECVAAQLPRGRVIAAHLGNGASLAAIRDGASVDTSMGFTPTSGVVMSTRSGDLDPAAVLYLLRDKTPRQVSELLNQRSGLLGLSGLSSDMSDLLHAAPENPAAAEAVSVFCYQVAKWIGSFAAALGGCDALAFSGGIGENAPEIRRRVCEALGFLNLRLDPQANLSNAALLSQPDSVPIRLIRIDEERIVARHAAQILR